MAAAELTQRETPTDEPEPYDFREPINGLAYVLWTADPDDPWPEIVARWDRRREEGRL